jgi:translation initiation factor IF-1
VREVGADGSYIVQIDGGDVVVARAALRVLAKGEDIEPGDQVRVEFKAEDMTRGIITSVRRTT